MAHVAPEGLPEGEPPASDHEGGSPCTCVGMCHGGGVPSPAASLEDGIVHRPPATLSLAVPRAVSGQSLSYLFPFPNAPPLWAPDSRLKG
jgi:hypothetical protein